MGTLGDRIGRRKLLLLGAAAFGTLSVIAAFSTSPTMLIVCRGLLGIAGAPLAPATLSLVTTMFTDEKQRTPAGGLQLRVAPNLSTNARPCNFPPPTA